MQEEKKESVLNETAKNVKNLNTGWRFREDGTDTWHEARVPGCNFTDLQKNGIIDDPFFRDNEKHLQWLEKKNWEYQTDFEISDEELSYPQIELIFEGLDTYADIYLNDRKIACTDNMFIEWKTEIRSCLKSGQNNLRVFFHSPILYVQEKAEKAGITYPAGNDHSETKLSVFSRKAPYHFGWDWAPRFVSCGIWRPVYLKFIDNINVQDLLLKPEVISDRKANIHVFVELIALSETRIKLTVYCLNGPFNVVNHITFLKEGYNEIKFMFSINDFKKWWPHGLGEAHLYHFVVSIKDHQTTICSLSRKVGIRKIEVINKPDDYGRSFYFKVNDVPVFAKGANYIPQDSFLPEVNDDRYQRLFKDIVAANMNMIRVWGGGVYERKLFYDLADQHGILVWQDFMFACTLYPGDEPFLQNVKNEVVANIRKLRGHASIALWCGNNEIKVGWHHWGWQELYNYTEDTQELLYQDYRKLFEKLLPEIVAEHDPDRFYLSSSPFSDYKKEEDFTVGDVHYWGVWHDEAPFSDYKKSIPRFMSEFGFQSFPIFESIKKYTLSDDWDISSPVMQLHQKHPRGNQLINDYLLQEFNPPKNFDAFLYLSQVLQAEGLKVAIEAHRRNKPYCMGSLYWQLNDCWPVASWSGIDYYGKWKALHYYVTHAFRNILVTGEISDNNLSIYVVSDLQNDETGTISLQIITMKGEVVADFQEEVEILANQSNFCVRLDLDSLIGDLDRNNLFIYARIETNDDYADENIYYLLPTKELSLQQPDIEYSLNVESNRLKVRLKSDVLVKNLYLWFDSFTGNFSDNFFDLLPGREKEITIPFQPELTGNVPELKMISVIDTY